VGELQDRRARKKAQTRREIRAVAQRQFAARGFDAVTIAEIAAEADVAVQTVFNHFPAKEELFFDGRTPWVEGAAEAVRSRADGVPPLRALREYLVVMVGELSGASACGERRDFLATLQASPTLRAYELHLVHDAEQRVAVALDEAWSQDDGDAPADPRTAAAVVASTWLAICRVLLTGQRPLLHDRAGTGESGERIESLADRLLATLEEGLSLLDTTLQGAAPAVTGWPAEVLRAG
jgi:AcrR family transcriptional regulator